MARARNIKPGFFKNYDLADLGPHAQLLFAGLWCLADKAGRLEDKPRFIKAEIFPYYEVDVNGELTKLERLGFICRYQAEGMALIEIPNFVEHQSPHHTEKASKLPARSAHSQEKPHEINAPEVNGEDTVKEQKRNGGNPPDSLIHRFTDSLIPEKDKPAKREPKYNPLPDLEAAGVDKQIAADWLAVRRAKRLPPTKTAIDGVLRELSKAGLTPSDGIRLCCERGWGGFDPSWINKPRAVQPYQTANDKARTLADRLTGRNRDERTDNANIIDLN